MSLLRSIALFACAVCTVLAGLLLGHGLSAPSAAPFAGAALFLVLAAGLIAAQVRR